MLWEAGVAESEKFGVAAAFTISDTEVECTRVLLVPVIVSEKVPVVVVVVVVTVMVDVPEPATEAGLKLAVAPLGKPVTLNDTTPVKPPDGVTVTVNAVFAPWLIVCDAGVAETE